MTSSTRLAVMFAVTAAIVAGAKVPLDAQIIFPFPPYPYRSAAYDGSVKFDVTPRDAEVYVDGYYAGVVDDFDGALQRLRVEPGPHEITLYREGYRAAQQRVYVVRDRTFRMAVQMQPLAPGEAAEPRPTPTPAPASVPLRTEPPRPLPRAGAGDLPPNAPPAPGAAQARTGQLVIRVQPPDADVSIDGQPWPAAPGQDDVVVDVSEGRHAIQVRKAGFVGYLREVEVRSGETVNVDVTLRPQP